MYMYVCICMIIVSKIHFNFEVILIENSYLIYINFYLLGRYDRWVNHLECGLHMKMHIVLCTIVPFIDGRAKHYCLVLCRNPR